LSYLVLWPLYTPSLIQILDALLDKKAALAKAKAEKLNKRPKENSDGSTRGRGSNFINSRDLDVSDMPSKPSKDSLPIIKRVTTVSPSAITRIEGEERFSKEFEKVQMQQQLQQHAENINPVEVSKKVLLKCNIIKPRKEGLRPLNKGDGHLMSMSEKSLKQVYEQVFHKSIVH